MSNPILLVGCGNMGGAMLRGWLDEGRGAAITVIDPQPAQVPPGARALATIEGFAGEPRVAVLAVKPQMLGSVAPALEPHVGPSTILLSVLAAVEVATLRGAFPRAGAIVRAVPNLPASIGAAATALAPDTLAEADRALVTDLCRSFGTVEWLRDEAQVDAATSVSGCGPAFLFRFADAVVRAGVTQGLEPDQARRLIAQTMIGAGRLLGESDLSPGEMADRVASPGGVTLAGLAVLDRDEALVRLIAETLAAAAARNAEMAAAARQA